MAYWSGTIERARAYPQSARIFLFWCGVVFAVLLASALFFISVKVSIAPSSYAQRSQVTGNESRTESVTRSAGSFQELRSHLPSIRSAVQRVIRDNDTVASAFSLRVRRIKESLRDFVSMIWKSATSKSAK